MSTRLAITAALALGPLTAALAPGAALAGGTAPAGAAATPGVTRAQLALMVLPQAQLGPGAAGLPVELPSGHTSNERAADDSFDPADTARSVTRAGRLYGYTLAYGDPGISALRSGRGPIDIGTSVDVFTDAGAARGYAAKTLRDLARVRGKNVRGVILAGYQTFRVRGIGHQGVGVRLVLRLGQTRLYGTYVDFRLGRLLADVAITRADGANVDALAVRVARSLERRIEGVLAGRVQGRPVPLPRRQGPPGRPPGAPDLAALALHLEDVPQGSAVAREEYVRNDDALAAYAREFRANPATSGLITLKSDVSLLRSATEAAGHMLVLRAVFGAPNAHETLTLALTGSGARAARPRLDEARDLKIGDEAFAIAVSFSIQGTRLRAVLLYQRTGRVLGTLLLTGAGPNVGISRAVPLARRLEQRIEDGFAPELVA